MMAEESGHKEVGMDDALAAVLAKNCNNVCDRCGRALTERKP